MDVEAHYQQYGPMVLRRCRSLLRDPEAALDVMHDTFVRLLEHQDDLDDRAPASLLLRIATHLCLNRLRNQKRRATDPVDAQVLAIARAESPEATWLARFQLGRAFRDELASTPVIAVLHLVDGLTHEEVAAEVGLSVSGVRKRLRTLKERMEKLEAADAA